MGQVTLEVHGRHYYVACDDGQEDHLRRLAAYVDQKVRELADHTNTQVSEAQFLLMAALMVADELAEVYEDLEAARASPPEPPALDQVAHGFEALAERIENIAARLAAT